MFISVQINMCFAHWLDAHMHIQSCVLVHGKHAVTFFVILTVKTGGTDSLYGSTWFDDALAGLALHTAFSSACVLA